MHYVLMWLPEATTEKALGLKRNAVNWSRTERGFNAFNAMNVQTDIIITNWPNLLKLNKTKQQAIPCTFLDNSI